MVTFNSGNCFDIRRGKLSVVVGFTIAASSLLTSPAMAQYPSNGSPFYSPVPGGDLVPLDRPATASPGLSTPGTQGTPGTQAPNGQLTPIDRPTPQIPNAPQFSFANALEYSQCLEVILRLYESSNQLTAQMPQSSCLAEIERVYGSDSLTKQEALSLVSSADFYATNLLTTKLYPLRGQRIRVTRSLGFLYEIDANNEQMRDLATPNSPGSTTTPLPAGVI